MITGKKSDSSGDIAKVAENANAATGGITAAADAAEDLKKSTSAAGKAAKKAAKDMLGLAGYDELNNMSSSSSSSGSSDSSGGSSSPSGGNLTSVPEMDFGKLETESTALDGLNTKTQKVIAKVKELAGLFAKGFKIGLGDTSVFGSIKKELASIKKSFTEIITDKGLKEAVNKWADSLATNFGKVAGSIASIGATIADNLLGGVSKFLEQHKKEIIKHIKGWFNISGEIADITGNYYTVLAEIAEVFRSDDAKQITADLINIFTAPAMNIVTLGLKMGRDLLNAITKPIIENKDAIKTALENTIKPLKTIISSISGVVTTTWGKIQKVYDEHVKPLIEALSAGISEICGTLLNGYNTHVAPVLEKISKNFKSVMEQKVQPAINTVIKAFGDVCDTVKILWQKWLQPLVNWVAKNIMPVLAKGFERAGNIINAAIGGIADIIKGIGKALSGVCTVIQGIVEGDWKKAWEGCKQTVSNIWDAIVTVFKTAWKIIKEVFAPVGEFFTTTWKAIKTAFSNVGEWFKKKFDDAYLKITLAFKLAGAYFKGKWNAIKEAFSGVKTWFGDKFSKAYESVTNAFSNAKTAFKNILSNIKAPFANIADWFKDKFSKAWEAVKKVFSSGGKVFSGIKSGIESTFKTVVNKLISGINTIIKAPFNKINEMLNTIREVGVAGVKPFKSLWSKNPLSVPQIPALAQGGFVKANTPQLAMIGDNKRYGEIVALENKMQAMVDAAVSKAGSVTANAMIPVIERLCNAIIELEQSGGNAPKLVPVSDTGLYRLVEAARDKEEKRRR